MQLFLCTVPYFLGFKFNRINSHNNNRSAYFSWTSLKTGFPPYWCFANLHCGCLQWLFVGLCAFSDVQLHLVDIREVTEPVQIIPLLYH